MPNQLNSALLQQCVHYYGCKYFKNYVLVYPLFRNVSFQQMPKKKKKKNPVKNVPANSWKNEPRSMMSHEVLTLIP